MHKSGKYPIHDKVEKNTKLLKARVHYAGGSLGSDDYYSLFLFHVAKIGTIHYYVCDELQKWKSPPHVTYDSVS